MHDLVLAYVNLGSFSSKENEFKISISFKKQGPSADLEKVKGGRYLKEILILN